MKALDLFEHRQRGVKQVPFEIVECEGWDFEKPSVEVHPANGCEEVEYLIESARRAALVADPGDEAPGTGT